MSAIRYKPLTGNMRDDLDFSMSSLPFNPVFIEEFRKYATHKDISRKVIQMAVLAMTFRQHFHYAEADWKASINKLKGSRKFGNQGRHPNDIILGSAMFYRIVCNRTHRALARLLINDDELLDTLDI